MIHGDVLAEEFPALLGNVYCGIDLPPGWYGLVRELCVRLTVQFPDVRCVQIKQKFGGLRFYADNAPDEAWALIDEYAQRSFSVCEQCGAAGSLRGGGWLLTLCNGCDSARKVK
jgi:hypothetical protein